jgi:hypothetical protein
VEFISVGTFLSVSPFSHHPVNLYTFSNQGRILYATAKAYQAMILVRCHILLVSSNVHNCAVPYTCSLRIITSVSG